MIYGTPPQLRGEHLRKECGDTAWIATTAVTMGTGTVSVPNDGMTCVARVTFAILKSTLTTTALKLSQPTEPVGGWKLRLKRKLHQTKKMRLMSIRKKVN